MILNDFYQYLRKSYIPEEDYVLFSSPTVFSLNGVYNSSYQIVWDGAVYYSTDGRKYRSWDKSVITAGLDPTDNLYKIYLQGKGNTYFKANSWYAMKITGSNITLSGTLEALLDAETVSLGGHPTMAGSTFQCAFRELPIVSAEDLVMPPCSSYPYRAFYGTFCDIPTLVYPPKILPALFLNTASIQELFINNTSMVSPPMILAVNASGFGHCLYRLFDGCSALTETPPILMKTSNADNEKIFKGCSSITRLPRITVAAKYIDAFRDCSNIKVSETQDATYQYAFTLPSGGTYTNMFANTGGTFTGTPTAETTYYTDKPLVEPYYPLKFSSANSFTIAQNSGTTSWDGTIDYSTDGYNWTTWDGTTITAASDGTKYNLYFRGSNNTYVGNDSNTAYWVITGSNVSVSGEMSALMDYEDTIARTDITITDYAYKGLFLNQTALVDASELIIEKVNVDYSCSAMFLGCTNLVKAPYLPATTLGYRCYIDMFQGCSSLTEPPALPATNLEGDCYYAMFGNCTSLVKAPALPATSMHNNVYREMFKGCSSLTKAPKLPATNMDGSYFYYQMFMDCTSLVKAPDLPATTLGWDWNKSQYYEMFRGCTSLTKAPNILITTMCYSNCCDGMFKGCTSLAKAPTIAATSIDSNKGYVFNSMFEGCTSLTEAPALLSTTLSQNCYSNMFKGCTSLTTAPHLPATSLAIGCYASMFEGCTNLEVIPDLTSVVADPEVSWHYANLFYGCSKVKVYTDPAEGEPLLTGFGDWNIGTFEGTSGDYTGGADNGVTYYTSNQLV